jgi:ribosome-associated protein
MAVLEIHPRVRLDEDELHFEFVRSSGPGGQNVNKVASAVLLRFDAAGSPSLPDDVRERLVRLAGRRMGTDGILSIQAQRFRTQESNKADAVERLSELIRRACERPKPRRETRPTRASKERRLESKRQRGETKRQRRSPGGDPD